MEESVSRTLPEEISPTAGPIIPKTKVLKQAGISKQRAYEAEKLAVITEMELSAIIAETREKGEIVTRQAALAKAEALVFRVDLLRAMSTPGKGGIWHTEAVPCLPIPQNKYLAELAKTKNARFAVLFLCV